MRVEGGIRELMNVRVLDEEHEGIVCTIQRREERGVLHDDLSGSDLQ